MRGERRADGPGGLDVGVLLQTNHCTAHNAGAPDPKSDPQDNNDLQLPVAEHGHRRDQNEQPRESHPRVHKALHDQVHCPSDIAAQSADH